MKAALLGALVATLVLLGGAALISTTNGGWTCVRTLVPLHLQEDNP